VEISNPTLERLEDQIGWYDRKSKFNQRWFKRLKVAQIVAGALVSFSAAYGEYGKYVAGALGVIVVLLEGLQSLNQFQHNWITYRATCEELKHEKYLYLAKADAYANADRPDALLAERVESLVSREHTKWAATSEKPQESGGVN
jgi:hypothetical protein